MSRWVNSAWMSCSPAAARAPGSRPPKCVSAPAARRPAANASVHRVITGPMSSGRVAGSTAAVTGPPKIRSSSISTPPGRTAAASRPITPGRSGRCSTTIRGVHQVVRAGLQRVAGHVVPDHLDTGKSVEEPEVDVGRGHPPARADRVGEPAGDRPGARADLEAVPPGATPAAARFRTASGSNIAAIPPSRACSSASPLSKKYWVVCSVMAAPDASGGSTVSPPHPAGND